MPLRILVRGGGDLASGVILRLFRGGFFIVVTELAEPLAVRRTVSFSEAIYEGIHYIENVQARRVVIWKEVVDCWREKIVPVMVDPELLILNEFLPDVFIDARMTKRTIHHTLRIAELEIGLGPGFCAGRNCDVVIETQRGPNLGRVYWEGEASQDTGLPDPVGVYRTERVLRAPEDGILTPFVSIGAIVDQGTPILSVSGKVVYAPFRGVIRGMLREGLQVTRGLKVGDLDPRSDPKITQLVSDKALAIGGGVLEAILSCGSLRTKMWGDDEP